MREVALHRCPVDVAPRTPAAPPGPGAVVLDGDVLLRDADSGAAVALQAVAARGPATIIASLLRHLAWAECAPRYGAVATGESRLSGISVSNSVFGALPPVPLRRRYGCCRAALDTDRPDLVSHLSHVAVLAAALAADVLPDEFAVWEASVAAKVAPAWRIADTLWTSGVINNNSAHPYHRDASNVRGSWSAMLSMKAWMEGGWLHLPDYGCYLAVPDGALTLFDGGTLLHGVTPFRLTKPSGYRFTVVYYARSGLSACAQDPAEEPARAARVAYEAARARVAP
jgi:hypothetical protein